MNKFVIGVVSEKTQIASSEILLIYQRQSKITSLKRCVITQKFENRNTGECGNDEQCVGPDKIPTSAIKTILTNAGVTVPANATDAQVKQIVLDRIAGAQQVVATQFEAANVQPSVTQTVLSAIGLP